MLIRTEIDRSGGVVLIRQEFVGVSGQVCGATFEVVGPLPGLYGNLTEARTAFRKALGPAVEDAIDAE